MKLKMKIAVLFALLFASMSWGWGGINELDIRICGIASDATTSFESQGYRVVGYDNTIGHYQDFLENNIFSNSPHVFMGYKETPYVSQKEGYPDSYNYNLPITNIIIRDLGSSITAAQTFDTLGARYYRLQIHDAYGNNYHKDHQGRDSLYGDYTNNMFDNHHIYIYYTRDKIDEKRVFGIKVVHGTPTLSNGITGLDRIDINLGAVVGQQTYMYVYRRAYSEEALSNPYYLGRVPLARNNTSIRSENHLFYTGQPRTLMVPGENTTSYASREEYRLGEYGSWSVNLPTATNVGEYTVYAKLVSNNPEYYDYIIGPVTAKIYKAPALKVHEYDYGTGKDYYLYSAVFKNQLGETYDATGSSASNFYSGDKITLTWSDKCGSSSRSFYRLFSDDSYLSYNELVTTGAKFNSGTYNFGVSFGETSNCNAMNYQQFATVTFKKSKLFFNSNGGSSVATIEGETGASYTKPANPTRTGYSFTGWSPALPSTIQRGEKTYKAGWTINKYTMTFDANGGKFSDGASIKRITQNYNTSITKPANPTKTDSAFVQWKQTSPASSNTTVPSIMPAQNITFTAQWKYDRFKVNMPSLMEVVSGDQASDGTYLNGSTVKFRVQSGYVVWGTVTYNGTVVTPDANGIYTIKVLGKDASVSATAFAEDHGAIQIAVDRSKAIIDGNKTGLVTDVPTAIAVGKVEMARTFTPFISTTIAVPFEVDLEYVWGGIFCEFLGMEKSGFKYTARLMFVSTKLEANVPYVFVPFDEHISIDLPQGWTLPIKTEEKSVVFGNWSFNSVYHKKVWTDGVSEEDGEGVVGYGFNASQSQSDGVSGSFAKLTSGSVGAMQAYISYAKDAPQAINRSPAMAGKSASSFSIEDLPDEIDVEVVAEDKKTVALGKINTVTGKIKLDCWFDMNGNLLKGKPTAKGVYVNNGRQVIVK